MQGIARGLSIVMSICVVLWADVFDDEMYQEMLKDSARQKLENSQVQSLDSLPHNTSTLKELFSEISEENTAPILHSTLLPEQHILPQPLPNWIYATAIIEVHFNDGSMRKGFATMLKNGLYITSAEIVHSASLIPRAIYAKMQDSSAPIIICTARLNLKAVDTYSGLALLENIASTDDYCNIIDKSYYHDRIQKRYVVNVFNNAPSVSPKQEVFYAYVDRYYYFTTESMQVGEKERYYDSYRGRNVEYGYQLDRDSYAHFAYGKGLFDSQGRFLGLMSLTRYSYLPVFIKKEVVQDFLCSLDEHKVLQDKDITQSCKRLHKRERFF